LFDAMLDCMCDGGVRERSTEDVDFVHGVVAPADHHAFEAKLRVRGFAHDAREGAPICRWRIDPIAMDSMPARAEVPGFANRRCPLTLETTTHHAPHTTHDTGDAASQSRLPLFVERLEPLAGTRSA